MERWDWSGATSAEGLITMAAIRPGKRTQASTSLRVLQRRTRVIGLYCQGKTQHEIARIERVSQGLISQDILAEREEWRRCRQQEIGEQHAEQMVMLDHLQATAWQAFELSQKPIRETVTQTKRRMRKLDDAVAEVQSARKALNGKGRAGTSCVPKALVVPVRLTVIGEKIKTVCRSRPEGDPRFLQLVGWCIEARLKMLGLLERDVHVSQRNVDSFKLR